MRQYQPKRCVDIKRLRLIFAKRVASRGVPHLPQADVTGQRAHVAGAKNIPHHTLGLVHEKFTMLLRDDTRRVLPAVLEQQQAVVNQLIYRHLANDADYAAHGVIFIVGLI